VTGVRISVVIPVHNRQSGGERALRSAVAQNLAGLEVIIVDDSSQPPFRLPSDLESSPIVQLIRHEVNRGAAEARNTGMAAARGKWIACLDSDDYWLPQTLGPRLEFAEHNFATAPDPMTLYAATFILDNRRTGRREVRVPRESSDPLDFASGCWFSPGSTILLLKETFNRVGPADPMLPRLEDLDWFLRFAIAGGRLKVWPDPVAVVETGHKPRIAALEAAAGRLQLKYQDHKLPPLLARRLRRRLNAYLDVERASVFAAERRWSWTLFHLARSIWLMPRLTVALEKFWRPAPLPDRLDPVEPLRPKE
jgi:glycosyltransferase involved in cell wall biosynthesis